MREFPRSVNTRCLRRVAHGTAPDLAQDLSDSGLQAAEVGESPTGVAAAVDERAGVVQRESCHACAEVVPGSVLPQKLLDVRQIEGRHRAAMLADVPTDPANGLRSAEVANDGDQQISRLEALQEREAFFGCEVASIPPVAIVGKHQLLVSRRVSAEATPTHRVVQVRAALVKGFVIDESNAPEIFLIEWEVVGLRQSVDDRGQILLVLRL